MVNIHVKIPRKLSDINKDWIGSVLQTNGSRCLKISSVALENAVEKGVNFTSNITRARASILTEARINVVYLIIKSTSESDAGRDFTMALRLFERECYVYNEYLPVLKQKYNNKSYPFHYVAKEKNGHGVVVMEDLNNKGYLLRDQTRPMALVEARCVVTSLATLHAHGHLELASISGFKFSFPFKELSHEAIDHLLKSSHLSIINIIKNQLVEYVGYVECIRKMLKTSKHSTFFPVDVTPGPYLTIIHGDAFNNNIMFRYTKDGVAVKLIDWQLTRPSSGVIELVYFLYSSTTPGLRKDHLEELLRLYHSVYLSTLKHYKSIDEEMYSYKNMMKEIDKWRPLAFFMAVMAARIVYDKSVGDGSGINAEKFKLMNVEDKAANEVVRDMLKQTIDEFIESKVLLSS